MVWVSSLPRRGSRLTIPLHISKTDSKIMIQVFLVGRLSHGTTSE